MDDLSIIFPPNLHIRRHKLEPKLTRLVLLSESQLRFC